MAADITGLILAGGEGRRMGGADKGLIEFAGRPLIEHVIERLQPQVGTLLISANRNLDAYRRYGFPVLTDQLEQRLGPLAGIQAGLQACTTSWLLVCPCDSPRLPLDLAQRMMFAQPIAMAVAATTAGLQPGFQLLHRDLLPALDDYLARGERRVSGWCRSQSAVEVRFDDASAFDNLNTPETLTD